MFDMSEQYFTERYKEERAFLSGYSYESKTLKEKPNMLIQSFLEKKLRDKGKSPTENYQKKISF